MKRSGFIFLVLVSFILTSIVFSTIAVAESGEDQARREIIVQFTPQAFAKMMPTTKGEALTGLRAIDELNRQFDVKEMRSAFRFQPRNRALAEKYGLQRTFILTVTSGGDATDAMLDAYSSDPDIVYAEPNHTAQAHVIPNDTFYGNQWGLNNTGNAASYPSGVLVGTAGADINAEAAWDIHTGNSSVILAILDSGVDYNHPEFAGRTVSGFDFYNNDSDPMDDNGHGTSCAGIAAAAGNNGFGVAGVNWGCLIMPVKVLSAAGSGSYANIADGITFAADNGADVISMSLGGTASSATLQNAVNYADGLDVAIFASRGNGNSTLANYPSSYANVISVGGLSPCNERKTPSTCDGENWWGASYGGGQDNMDFVAPCTRIYTTDITGSGGYEAGDYMPTFNGTSSACPFAAGVGALLRSYEPSLTNDQVRQRMRDTAVDVMGAGYDAETGFGRIDAYLALTGGSGNSLPTANANGPYAAEVNIAINFSSAGSNDTDGTITSYLWDFGDGNTSSAANPSHAYSSTGTYNVSLTVTDNDGGIGVDNTTATITGPVSYATLPYNTGFESGSLDQYWTTTSSNSFGRIQVTSANSPNGSYHLTMDSNTNNNFAQNEAWLHLDLSGETQVDLDFQWKEFSDESHSQDGVYLSDDAGASFTKVYDLTVGTSSYQTISLDIDALAASNGLSLNGTFVIKFQQYDNYSITTDGHAFDDINVEAGTTGGGGDWVVLTYDDFESGWGNYVDGGSDCRRSANDANYAHQGTYCVRIRDNTNSSVFTNTSGVDLTGYDEARISFWYYPRSMDNSNEDFWVQLNDGSGWTTVAAYAQGTDFSNGSFYQVDNLIVTSSEVSFTSGVQVRFRCDASGNSDWIYIDEVEVAARTTSTIAMDNPLTMNAVIPTEYDLRQNYPNPFNPTTTIEFSLPEQSDVTIRIFSVTGALVRTLVNDNREAGIYTLQWDGTTDSGIRVATGVYFYRMVAGNEVQTRRMTLLK